MITRAEKLLNIVAQTIYDKKGANILALDVRDVSNMTDFCIIAEGSVDRHLQGIARAIEESLGFLGEKVIRVDGEGSDWIVMDYSDVIIHLLLPSAREKYALEELWRKAKIVNVNINTK